MTLAVLAATAYGGVLAWVFVLAPKVIPITATLGVLGGGMLGLVVVRGVEDLLGSAILFLAAAYVLALYAGRHVLDEGAPLVAVALLACTELATWSLQEHPPVAAERGLLFARARALAALAVAGLVAASLVLVASAASVGGGLAWAVVGAVAAVLAVALTARLGRS